MDASCNIDNRTIFCHDNLEVLQGINTNCIDLIYLDPPFNKNKKFTAPVGTTADGASFDDIFRDEDLKEEWLWTIRENNPELYTYLHGIKGVGKPYNFAYLAYMAIRLIECHRILTPTGCVYLHCDPTMSHYLKTMMDCIYGEDNFRNEIVWWYGGGGASKKHWGRKHDVILYYTKSKKWTFNTDKVRESYKWDKGQRRADGSSRDLQKGKLPDDVFQLHGVMPWAKERTGYPTQKPIALLNRIITASTNEGEVVLDPFCGCATTCVAAEQVQRRWVGIDISVKAYDLVRDRLAVEVADKWDLLKSKNEVTMQTEPPKRSDQGSNYKEEKYVYVISHPKFPGEYKVGIAKNWEQRLSSYQTSDPDRQYKLEFKHLTPQFRETEKYIHETFPNKHEWVAADLDEITRAISGYDPGAHEQSPLGA